MTRKVYRVEFDSCRDCPFSEYVIGEWFCKNMADERQPEPDSIPDWCPLPDAEKEQAR